MLNLKIVMHVFSIMVMCFIIIACGNQVDKKDLGIINDSAKSRLEVASKKFDSEGIEAAAQYCAEDQKLPTNAGVVIVKCTVCADFYNPQNKITVIDNNIILPISIYTQAKDGMQYLKNGYEFRDVSITVFAKWEEGGDLVATDVAQKNYALPNGEVIRLH